MKNNSTSLRWLLFATILFFVALDCFLLLPPSSFRDNFLGNLFATLLGIIVGIPVAWDLEKHRQAAQERAEQARNQQERNDRKTKVLQRIKGELSTNWSTLSAMINLQREDPLIQDVAGLKDELWSAFSGGGELQWIDDPEILDSVSYAYHYIKRIIYLEEMYFSPDFKGKVVTPEGKYSFKGARAVDAVNQLRSEAIQYIKLAIKKIDAYLQS